MQFDVHDLTVEIDDATGQLRSIHDRGLDRRVVDFAAGNELELNGVAIDPEPIDTERQWGCPLTRFDLRQLESYIAGARYRIHRTIAPGSFGAGRGRSVHLRYSIRRVPWGDWKQPGNELWEHPIETPQTITSFAALCAPLQLFGERTHVRSIAIGGSGPREHVSIEDALYAEALPYLQNPFRTTFPGQATVPGALYYDPEDQRWVWIVVHHPTIGGDLRFDVPLDGGFRLFVGPGVGLSRRFRDGPEGSEPIATGADQWNRGLHLSAALGRDLMGAYFLTAEARHVRAERDVNVYQLGLGLRLD